MERTPRLFRITVESLPPAPDTTIVISDAGGAVDEKQGRRGSCARREPEQPHGATAERPRWNPGTQRHRIP